MPEERKTALVIFGAGASYDVVPPLSVDDPSKLSTPVVDHFRPVLARDIFTDSIPVREALAAYPKADDLSSTIRSSSRGLEAHLCELSASTTGFRRRGIREVPLYLRDLFTSISDYTRDPINYKALLQRLFDNSGFDRVTIVSLNYDLLLDRVLEVADFGGVFASMEDYDRPRVHPHLLYVKLHGSVNWAWRLPGFDPTRVSKIVATTSSHATVRAYLDLIHQATEWPASLGDPVIVGPRAHFEGDVPLYPALAIPTGEYKFICPDAQVKKLREFLPTCGNVLVIGCSARDERLLHFLDSHLHAVRNVVLVDSGVRPTVELKERFLERVPVLNLAKQFNLKTYDGGFSEFLRSGGLENFIDAADYR